MKIRKSLAGVAAGALAVTGIAVVTAPAADAYSGSETIRCRLYFSDAGVGSSPSSWTETISLTQSPANPNAGDNVTVTVSSTGGGNNGPIGVNANTLRLAVNVVGTGTAPSSVALQSSAVGVGSYPASNIAAYAALGPWSATGSYVASGNGAGSLALGQIKFDAIATDSNNVDTYCSDSATDIDHKASPVTSTSAVESFTITGPNASVSSIAQGTGSGPIGAGVTGYARSGNVLTLGGTVWTASTAIDSVTVGGAAATNTLAVDGSGNIAGTVTVPAGATTGLTSIVITQGSKTSSTPITILGTPTITLSPASSGPGQSIAVTGSNFNPLASATLYSCPSAPCIPFGGSANTTATGAGSVSASGVFTGSILAAVGGTTIQAGQGSGATALAGYASFTLNQDTCTRQVGSGTPTLCETKQNVNAVIQAGALTQTASDFDGAGSVYTTTSIDFGAVTSSVASQTVNRSLNPLTVADARGGALGWSLTAAMPNLVNTATGTIANSNMAVSGITCVANAAGDPGVSATGNTAGTGGTLGGTVTLCTKNTNADSAGDTSGGQYLVNAGLGLTVPAFQQTGTYTSTITVTLT